LEHLLDGLDRLREGHVLALGHRRVDLAAFIACRHVHVVCAQVELTWAGRFKYRLS